MRGGLSEETQDQLAALFAEDTRYKFGRSFNDGSFDRMCSLTDFRDMGLNIFFGGGITAQNIRKMLKMPLEKLPRYLDGTKAQRAIAAKRLEKGI
jgi:hypothetical protein